MGCGAKILLRFLASFFVIHMSTAAVKGPPVASHHRTKQVVLAGSNARLSCPMSGHPNPMIDWTKDREGGIIDFSWTRFETNKKTLKISRVQPEDTGIYRCKGTNGFGSTSVRIDLLVIDPHDYPESMAAGVIPDRVRPVWTQETVSLRAVYRKKAGESARLVCEALGSPEPEVAWLRGDGTRVQAGLGRTVLHADTSGRYTCVASNGVGDAVTKNVSVNIASPEVIRDDAGVALPQVPALKMTGPGNTTVQQGNKASLECRVHSTIQSEIMWLKQLEHTNPEFGDQGGGSIIDLGKDKFKILEQRKPDDAEGRQSFVNTLISASEEGVEYLNTMIIEGVVPADAGTYYCFVKNPIGYKFKGAYLNVMPKQGAPNASSSASGLEPGSVLILVICLVLIVVLAGVTVAVCVVVRRRHKSSSAAAAAVNTSHFTSSTNEAPELTENLMRHANHHQQMYLQQQQFQNHYSQPFHHHPQQQPPPPPPNSLYHQQISNNNRNGQLNLIVNKMSDAPQSLQPQQFMVPQQQLTDPTWLQQPGTAMYHHVAPPSSGGGASNLYIDAESQNQYEVPHAHEIGGGVGGKPLYGYKMY